VRFRVSTGSSVPLFRQIVDQVARGVAHGEVEVGHPLPSVRQLARELVINPNTVAKAYGELVDMGLVETQPGRGFFIAKKRQVFTKTERLRRLDETIEVLVNQAAALDFSPDEVFERVQELFARHRKVASE
jgi:GntR family transcriptional regulator